MSSHAISGATVAAPAAHHSSAVATPVRLRLLLGGVVALAALLAATSVLAVLSRQAATRHAAAVTEPAVVAAQGLYTALSDADTTAAGGLLAGPIESARAQARYQEDVAVAGDAVAYEGPLAEPDTQAATALHTLAVGLPVYAGLVERATADNRLGFPVASAYLNEASSYLRGSLLPAATTLYASQSAALEVDRVASSTVWPVVLGGVLQVALVVLLLITHRWVRDRFHRRFTIGVLAALLAVIALGGWGALALVAQTGEAEGAERDGSALLATASQARLLALQAHADDELTLMSRESVPFYQQDYTVTWARLHQLTTGQTPLDLGSAGTAVERAHEQLRALVRAGDYGQAVAYATGAGASELPAASGQLDDALAAYVVAAQRTFDQAAAQAQRDLAGLAAGVVLLCALTALGTWAGLAPRLREYR